MSTSEHKDNPFPLQPIALINADYQFELRLISYVNPRGLTDDGQCCEPEAVVQNQCLEIETCDTRFTVQLRNLHRLPMELGGNVVIGVFDNNNSITFPTCGPIIDGIENPLMITFPRSQLALQVCVLCINCTRITKY